MIAHYHWQVGLVADGRLLAAAAAASSDTARGLAGFTRVFPPITLLITYACRESLEETVGSPSPQGHPPRFRIGCGPQAGRGEEPRRLSHFLPFLFPLQPAHLPLPHRNTKGLGHLAGDFLAAQLSPRGCRLPLPAAYDPLRAPSSGGAGVSPSLLRFLKCLQIQKRFRNAFRLREPEDLG